jgi:hypothetical protein
MTAASPVHGRLWWWIGLAACLVVAAGAALYAFWDRGGKRPPPVRVPVDDADILPTPSRAGPGRPR